MTNPKKIALVLDDGLDRPDGVQQYVMSVGEWLRAQGHDVHYLVGQTSQTSLQNVHSLARNLSVRFNGNRLTIPLPTSRKKLRAVLDKERFDVIHVQVPYSPFMAGRIIKLAAPGTKVVGTFHILPDSWIASLGSWLLGWWLRPTLRRFDAIVSVSRAAQAFSKRMFGVDSEVLPNVFDYQRFAAGNPRFTEDGRLTILFLGRLVPRKGCEHLLKAVAALDRAALPAFRVVVCGKGPLLPKLEDFVQKHGLKDVVEFAGFVEEADKPDYYASADISVFPSTSGESFGIVLIEAMASGKAAVLAGNNPGYASVMDQRTDLLFNPRETQKLKELLEVYLTDEAKRLKDSAWAREYSKQFDVELVGDKLLKLYDKK